ncbi:hypothetical protein [Cryobacterium sp. Y11]|jgi:hypothetical protein|nr:hypothetical protein [Cryobacterium sp. Y11]
MRVETDAARAVERMSAPESDIDWRLEQKSPGLPQKSGAFSESV